MKRTKILFLLLWLIMLPLGTVGAQGFVLPTKKAVPYVKKAQHKVVKRPTSAKNAASATSAKSAKRSSSAPKVSHTKKTSGFFYILKSSSATQRSSTDGRPGWLDGTWCWKESTLVIDGCDIAEIINGKYHSGTCDYDKGYLTAWFSDENGTETGYVIDLVNKAIGTGEEGENYRKISNSTSFEELREQAEEESNKIFDECDQMPSFPGNLMAYLSENVKYPVEAQENGIQGRVVVAFVVEKDGSLSDMRVARSVSPELDAEALRVVSSMPKWNPGMSKGKYVRVKFNVPVSFRLQ